MDHMKGKGIRFSGSVGFRGDFHGLFLYVQDEYGNCHPILAKARRHEAVHAASLCLVLIAADFRIWLCARCKYVQIGPGRWRRSSLSVRVLDADDIALSWAFAYCPYSHL